jgi:formylmethanofuran dehydrogenase subunit B
MHAHPRHTSRYSIFPRGFFTPKGQMQRTIISIDPRESDTAKLADIHYMLQQGHDYELFDAFRTVLRGHDIPDEVAGIKKEQILKGAEAMKKARFVMIFFGMGCTHTDGRNHNVDIAISLTRDLNTHTKASIMAMRGHYNIAGPGQVWSWQFGFPYCIDLSKGTHAHMNPGETSSVDLAMRDEVDCFVNVGTDAGAHWPIDAVKHVKKHPFITIDPNFCMASEISDLHIPVRIAGVDEGGVVYRMDNVPIQFKAVLKGLSGVPSDEELFDMIYERMCVLTQSEPIWLTAKEDRKYPSPVVS